jgi:hypothetical protein
MWLQTSRMPRHRRSTPQTWPRARQRSAPNLQSALGVTRRTDENGLLCQTRERGKNPVLLVAGRAVSTGFALMQEKGGANEKAMYSTE